MEAELKQDWIEAAEAFFELRLWAGVKRVAQAAAADRRPRSDAESERMTRVWNLRDFAGIREVEMTRGPEAAFRMAARMPHHPHLREIRAELAVKAELWTDAMRAFEALARWDDARRCAVKSGNPKLAVELDARAAESENRWADAERLWTEAGNPRRAMTARAVTLETSGAFAEAAAAWDRAGQRARANRLRKQLMQTQRQAAGNYLPPGQARTDAMMDFILKHPGCSRKQVQTAVNLTSGEALSSWGKIERDKRVEVYWWGNSKVYGPTGWVKKKPAPPFERELF